MGNLSITSVLLCSLLVITSCSVAHVRDGAKKEIQGKYDEAIKEWSAAIAANPKSAVSYHHRAYDYSKLGSYQSAIDDETKAIEFFHSPLSKAKSYAVRANAYIQLQDYKKAIDDCTQAINLDAKSGNGYFLRSKANDRIGKRDLADLDRTKAEELGYTSEPTIFSR